MGYDFGYQSTALPSFQSMLETLGLSSNDVNKSSEQFLGEKGFKKPGDYSSLLETPNYAGYEKAIGQLGAVKTNMYDTIEDKFNTNMVNVNSMLGRTGMAGQGYFDKQANKAQLQFGQDAFEKDKALAGLYGDIEGGLAGEYSNMLGQARGFVNSGAKMYKHQENNEYSSQYDENYGGKSLIERQREWYENNRGRSQ